MTAEKSTKKRDARAKLLTIHPFAFLTFSLSSLSSHRSINYGKGPPRFLFIATH